MFVLVTIKEVAKVANVSVATVSRVINNDNKVSEVTKQRVLEVINKLGYVPNVMGRNLRISKTNRLLVIIPELCSKTYEQTIKSIMTVAENYKYFVFFAITNKIIDNELKYINTLKNKSIDGIISLGTTFGRNELYDLQKNFSIVIAYEKITDFNIVQVFSVLKPENQNKHNNITLNNINSYFIKV